MDIDFSKMKLMNGLETPELREYGFSVYDDLVALMVTGYLKTVDRKLVLKEIVDPRILAVNFEEGTASALYTEVDGKALAALLEASADWCRKDMALHIPDPRDRLTRGLQKAIRENVLDGFSGKRYVANMPNGFPGFITKLYLNQDLED